MTQSVGVMETSIDSTEALRFAYEDLREKYNKVRQENADLEQQLKRLSQQYRKLSAAYAGLPQRLSDVNIIHCTGAAPVEQNSLGDTRESVSSFLDNSFSGRLPCACVNCCKRLVCRCTKQVIATRHDIVSEASNDDLMITSACYRVDTGRFVQESCNAGKEAVPDYTFPITSARVAQSDQIVAGQKNCANSIRLHEERNLCAWCKQQLVAADASTSSDIDNASESRLAEDLHLALGAVDEQAQLLRELKRVAEQQNADLLQLRAADAPTKPGHSVSYNNDCGSPEVIPRGIPGSMFQPFHAPPNSAVSPGVDASGTAVLQNCTESRSPALNAGDNSSEIKPQSTCNRRTTPTSGDVLRNAFRPQTEENAAEETMIVSLVADNERRRSELQICPVCEKVFGKEVSMSSFERHVDDHFQDEDNFNFELVA